MPKHVCVVMLFFCVALAEEVCGQNLESIGKENPIKITGGASLNQIFYSVNGIESTGSVFVLRIR